MAARATGERARGGTGGRLDGRRALVALALLIAVGLALRLWYLPSLAWLQSEEESVARLESEIADGQVGRNLALRVQLAPPLGWYPQLLAIELARGLREGGIVKSRRVLTVKGRVTRRGLLLARHVSLLYGLAGLALLYAIARRLHSPAVALLAVLVLCFTPWHVQASVTFGPEILVATLVLLALWLALRALDRPSPLRFALVGVAVGAAAAAQPSGAPVALPVLAGLIGGSPGGLRRRLLPLAVAVPAAALVWWALSPPLGPYLDALQVEQASQARRAAWQMSSRFTVAVYGFLHPLLETVHGRLLGGLALLGAAGQAFRCLFLVDPGPDRAHRLMVLAAAPALILGFAWTTPLYRASGFVPLVAFSSLYAAVMLAALWDGLLSLVPRLATPWAATVAVALAVALVAPPGWRFVRSGAVGTTIGAALDWSRARLPGGAPRVVLVEQAAFDAGAGAALELAGGLGVQVVPRLAALRPERLALADGEVFPRRARQGPDAAFYRGRGEPPASRRVIASSLLWSRGPDLVAVLHPPAGEPTAPIELPVERHDRRWLTTVPAAPGGFATLTLMLFLPPASEIGPESPAARLGENPVQLAPGGWADGRPAFFSERLPTAPSPRRLEVELPPWNPDPQAEMTARMVLWP